MKKRTQPIRGHRRVEAHALHVFVARKHPGLQVMAPVRRVLVLKPPIHRKRIGEYPGIIRPVDDQDLLM